MKTTPVLTLVRLIQAVFAALLTGILSPENIHAQDYMGANAVLHKVEESCAKPNEKHEKDEPSKLRDDLKLFGQISVHLAPAEAATRWLELVDRAAKIQRQSAQNYNPSVMPITADDLMNVLPPPAVWNELAKAIAMRPPAKDGGDVREAGLRLLAATLTGDAAGRSREITNIQAKAAAADRQSAYFYREILGQLGQAVLTTSDDPDDILKSLGYQLAYTNGQDVCRLMMPNLILLIGAEKAEVFLRKALVTPKVMLEFRMPDETSRLAQKLALELMDQLKTPQWGLVNSLDAIDLYEALDKHFGGQTSNSMSLPGVANVVPDINPINQEDDDQKSSAEIYYMLGLISKNRTQEAVAVAKRLKGQNIEYMCDEAFKAMENAGYTSALDNFLHALLSQNPTLPFWDQYVETATHAGQTERMLILVRDTITHEGLSDNKQATLHKILFKALLAADDVDGGLQEARRLIALDATKQSNSGYNAGELGIMITQIGVLLQKPKLTEEGIGVAKKWLATHADQNSSNWETTSILVSLTKILFELKRGPEAESILTDALVNAVRTGNLQPDYSGNGGGPPRQILAELVTLYYQAGRYDNVLDLLEQSPNWSAKDLSELFELSLWGNQISMMPSLAGSSRLPIPYLAASSLVAKGRKEQAQKITDALLDREPGLDRGYELLLALNGAKAIPRLDELFERDQFEERPLIWKAYLLRQQNLLAEAEKILRQAIAIDPTDGEEGRGDRLRAYAELADVLEARGNKKEADFYHRIVKAVRLSEDADQFYMAGLLKRAGAMYQEALNSFSDAYCIQARLAIQLAALGKNEEAEEHYRRAYEL
ncbi:MAG TPA: hypothetical protein VMI53_00865, partial [Opitutaceae bacterium]|nr:hypothetical protein [Opitutaceae bacterium]